MVRRRESGREEEARAAPRTRGGKPHEGSGSHSAFQRAKENGVLSPICALSPVGEHSETALRKRHDRPDASRQHLAAPAPTDARAQGRTLGARAGLKSYPVVPRRTYTGHGRTRTLPRGAWRCFTGPSSARAVLIQYYVVLGSTHRVLCGTQALLI